MGLSITLANQAITSYTDENSLDIESILGQGPGVPATSAARTTTFKARVALGPAMSAYGAGQSLPDGYITAIAADNPLRYYRLAESSGTVITDSSAYKQNGTATGAGVTYGVTGLLPYNPSSYTALSFNGSTGNISVPAAGLPTGASPWSLECWFSCTNVATGAAIALGLGTWGTTNAAAQILVKSSGLYAAEFGDAADAGPYAIVNNTVYHAVATYDGVNLRLYVNGVLRATSNSITLALGGTTCYIANAAEATLHDQFPGTIQHAAVYGYVLTPTQIATHYARGTAAGPPVLVRQGEVVVSDATGTRIFGGYVSNLEDVTEPHDRVPKTMVTAVDYWQALDRIGVNLLYVAQGDNYIIKDIITNYAPWIDLSAVNLTATSFTFPRVFLRGKTVSQALQYVADTTGFDIWVDAYKKLHYVSPTGLGSAPFKLTDSNPDGVTTFAHKFVKGPNLDDTAIINRVTFYGGKRPSADFTQDLSPQANGSNKVFTLAYYPRESTSGKVVVTVAGVSQVVGYALGSNTSANILVSQGGSANVLLDADAQTLTFDTAPGVGVVVHATYRYQTPLVLQVANSASYAYFGNYFDGYISDESVQDVELALARCRVLLVEQAYGLTSMTVRCWQPGLQAGVTLNVTNTTRGVSGSYVIQQVKVVPLGAGNFAYDCDLGAYDWHLADILMAGAHAAAATDISLNEQTDIIVANDGTVSVGAGWVQSKRATATGQYYSRSAAVGDGSDAYPGLFTIAS